MAEYRNFLRQFDKATGIQLLRFAFIGVIFNLFLYLSYLLITSLGVGHKTAMTALYATGTGLTFVLNKKWTFEHKGHVSKTFLNYVLIYLFGYLLNFCGLYLFVDRLGFSHQLVQGILIFVIALLLFLLQKSIVFKKGKDNANI